ncbi:tail fiber assembly protein [Enterobacter roggenkampii]|uniref:tail fiber assembly protein n=2 Tax=Enterobacter roggenkampii TaxID=1812935 RepID=UPI00200582ED|nr:tail fiber assembly protein [Enterobacter roggenkampii]MCK6915430.1 tail fiber assembly protein [Enterobacter roggenkampii]
MKYVYSATSNAFYPVALKSSYEATGDWPVDGVEVDEAVFATYTGTAPSGKMMGADEKGYPAWVSTPPLTHEQQIAIAENEKASRIAEANSFMNSKPRRRAPWKRLRVRVCLGGLPEKYDCARQKPVHARALSRYLLHHPKPQPGSMAGIQEADFPQQHNQHDLYR